MIFLRPVASIAARNSAESHASTVLRSMAVTSVRMSCSSGIVGLLVAGVHPDRREDDGEVVHLGCLGHGHDVVDQHVVLDREGPVDEAGLVVDEDQRRVLRGEEVVGLGIAGEGC